MYVANLIAKELFEQQPELAHDEDYIGLLERGEDYIYYVRNYKMAQEFIVVSDSVLKSLPNELRPITNVFLRCNFHAIRMFKTAIMKHILESNQIGHFNHLFHCSISEFFDSL